MLRKFGTAFSIRHPVRDAGLRPAGKLTCFYFSITFSTTQPLSGQNLQIFPGAPPLRSPDRPPETEKAPRAAGKETAAVPISFETQLRRLGSPLAARRKLLMAGMELLAEDQIVDVPVLPHTAPNAVGLTLHHRHASHLLMQKFWV